MVFMVSRVWDLKRHCNAGEIILRADLSFSSVCTENINKSA